MSEDAAAQPKDDADAAHPFARLLRARHERPRGRSAAEQSNELAAFHH